MSARRSDPAVLLLLAALALASGCAAGPRPLAPGEPLLAGAALDGTALRFDAGGPPLLCVFWASWCKPCRAEMPAILRLDAAAHARYQVVGIAADEDAANARAAQRDWGLTFPNLDDHALGHADRFAVTVTPTMILLAGDGRELYRGHAIDAGLRAALERAIEPRPPTP